MSKTRKQIVLETLTTLANMLGADEPPTMCDAFCLTENEAFDVDADSIRAALMEYSKLCTLYDAQTKSLELQTETTDRLRAELANERAAHNATSAQLFEAKEMLQSGSEECDRLRAELKATTCDLDRADRMEAQRDAAIRDTAAALRVVRLMAKDGQEAKQ